MHTQTFIAALLGLSLFPFSILCGTPIVPGERVIHPHDATIAKQLKETDRIAVVYGESSIGYRRGYGEMQAQGPSAFEVGPDGVILVADKVNRRFVRVEPMASHGAKIRTEGALDRSHPMLSRSKMAEQDTRVRKLGAETGAVDFGRRPEDRVRIELGRPLASLRLVGVDGDGRAFVLVEQYRQLGKIAVDRWIMIVSNQGEVVAKRKMEGVSAVPVVREFFVTASGALYRMLPASDRVVFFRFEVKP